MLQVGVNARQAMRAIASASTQQKNAALNAIAASVQAHSKRIVDANRQDMQLARDNNLNAALLDRLELNQARIGAMIGSLEQVASLADPIGAIDDMVRRPSGIEVGKMRVPLGVIGIIYESRPNVTIDAASLCLKSGNAAVLRGGSEAFHSNQAIAHCIEQGLEQTDLPSAVVQVLETADRDAVGELITATDYVDVIIPRGSKSLIERISKDATIPVIKHLDGNCHVYIDSQVDVDKAIAIAVNSKTHRYGVCNAMETLLIAEDIAAMLLPKIAGEYQLANVEMRCCSKSAKILDNFKVTTAVEEDWYSEYLAPIVAIKIVDNVAHAIAHINHYGSAHSDAIVTENLTHSRQFVDEIDSSSVLVNASTRFADGFEYGLGAEIGISTNKIHARGPVGLEGLTSQKWVVYGNGTIRQ